MATTSTRQDGMVKVAPRAEKGSMTGIPLLGVMSWAMLGAQVANDLEYVPELMWPNSVHTFQQMRNDSQLDGLMRGCVLPISRWAFGLDPNNADPAIVRELSRDLGLPIAERSGDTWKIIQEPIPRSQSRFDFQEHQTEALLAPFYGHQFFEQVADLIPPPADWPVDVPLRARLRKLAVRPPWTLTEIDTEPDGGLKAIKQLSTPVGDPGIPVTQLAAYIWGKEGANWVGRSLLRSCYRPWLIKDRVIRVGAINIERNGAGVPIITAPPGATKPQIEALDNLSRRIRAGDSAGGAMPDGAVLQLMGVMGSQPDAEGFMRFLNEEMARSFLQMVQVLGQTHSGSRALGQTFLDIMMMFIEAMADWFCAIFQKHVIEDWMIWNVGESTDPNEDAYAPRLVYVKSGLPTQPLADAAANGQIQVDQQTQAMLENPDAHVVDEPATTSRYSRTSRRAARGHGGRDSAERRAAGTAAVSLPARPLRRQPYDHEVAAAVDFQAVDAAYTSALDLLMMEVRQLIGYQVDELHDAIVQAGGDLDSLSEISANVMHGDVIGSRLMQVAELAANQAVNEASSQSVTVERPDITDLQSSLSSRANVLDTVITRDVTEAAVRRAIRLTGGALDATGVANQVRDEMRAMTWVGVRDQLGAAVQGAQNAARGLVYRRDGQDGDLYSSEILDTNTCTNCIGRDGTHYGSMDEAEQDYPFGGYKDCLGGGRCRGLLIKVYNTENPALA